MNVDRPTTHGHPGLLRTAVQRLRGTAQASSQAEQDIAYLNECELFDRDAYLAKYPDVAQAGIDPIEHYVVHGAGEGRDPSDLFDTAFYLDSNPDVTASGMNPFRHFCEFGWKEMRAPSPGFDVRAYASAYMGEDSGRVNPLMHLRAHSNEAIITPVLPVAGKARDDYGMIVDSGIFDADFYLASYPSVAKAGVDPVRHYLEHGASERRNPSPFFDTGYYLDANPDVATAGVNPLGHFCGHGWKEFRQPSPQFDIVRYWLAHMAAQGEQGNPLTHYLRKGRAGGLPAYRLEEQGALERNRMVSVAESMFAVADTETLKKLGRALARITRWNVAERAFRQVAAREWSDPANHVALARVLAAQGKWWLVVESMAVAVGLNEHQGGWFFMLADANERMGRFAAAADAFRQAVVLSPGRADWHYRLGYVLERAGAAEQASDAYEEALRLSDGKEAALYGVGVFHQSRGLWEEARDAYFLEIAKKPLEGGLRYRLGMTHDRMYEWQAAADCYAAAIALSADTRMPSWHFRLGFVLERMGRWSDAADAYAAASVLSGKPVAYWSYRLGYVLEAAGLHEDACVAYRETKARPGLVPGRFRLPAYMIENRRQHRLIAGVVVAIVTGQ